MVGWPRYDDGTSRAAITAENPRAPPQRINGCTNRYTLFDSKTWNGHSATRGLCDIILMTFVFMES